MAGLRVELIPLQPLWVKSAAITGVQVKSGFYSQNFIEQTAHCDHKPRMSVMWTSPLMIKRRGDSALFSAFFVTRTTDQGKLRAFELATWPSGLYMPWKICATKINYTGTIDFCLSTSIPFLTTSTYEVAWPQGDQLGGGPWHKANLPATQEVTLFRTGSGS